MSPKTTNQLKVPQNYSALKSKKGSDSDLIKKPFPVRAGNYDDPDSEQSFGQQDVSFEKEKD